MASITVNMSHSGGTKNFTYNFSCDGGNVTFQKASAADTWYSFTANTSTKTVTISAQTNNGDSQRTATLNSYVDGTLCADKDAEIIQKNNSDWLTFSFTSSGKLVFDSTTNAMPRYSKNGGSWTSLPSTGVTVASGDKIRLRGPQDHVGLGVNNGIGEFGSTTGTFTLGGKIATLLYDDYFDIADTEFDTVPHAFENLFYGCTGLTSIADLKLPLIVSQACYYQMFLGCENLVTVPSDLLPAIYLANDCYSYMFEGCTALTKAPTLPAKVLKESCYEQMFYGCESLNEITCLAENISADNCTNDWVDGVASSGTFKCKSSTNWTIDDISGIPDGWTREDV